MTTPSISQTKSPDNTPDNTDFLRLFEAVDSMRASLLNALPTLYQQFEIILCAAKDVAELDDDYGAIYGMFGRLQCPNSVDVDALNKAYKTARAKLYRAMPYPEYLQTDHWQDLREEALERANHRCQVCNSNEDRLETHHRCYDRRGDELPEDLIVLCRTCHELFHKNGRLAR